ncbi:MAG TPA: poly-beta-1,6-N-acetyl-D-glucosamine N-deacetylase PgaB, partial [Burkholderiaceae bacterium]|nr:poly-beta-1,6-N-acetyl-D-glucosamine N-deacetylase PgaB [Burkholderiaceae bacterium]
MRTLRDAFCRVGGAIAVAVAAAAGMIGPADARAQPAPPIAPIALPAGHFVALSYHDVAPSLRDSPERDTVETAALAQQFDWLRANGYTVVGIDELIAAQRGERPLPPKAVLLTFDDGYRSFYTQVFPLLKAFGYKATVALVGAWLDAPPGSTVIYDGKPVPRERFLDWDQIREMADSGLVELASHSYDAHHGVVANPQGNLMPALTARIWDSATGRYETPQQWRGRVHEDLRRNSELIERNAGRRPRVMVWPYGSYNGELVRIAASLGMPVAQTLDGGPNDVSQHLSRIRRKYVEFNPNIGQFASMIRDWDRTPAMLRPIHIDLDYAYDPDPAQQERNLDRLVERIKSSQAGTVFLQAFADPDGNGAADALYFPNRHLPMRADLFARAAWQLRTRANVEVYAWMPLMAFELPPGHPVAAHRVEHASGGVPGYPRLSPYSEAARATIREI